jgi:hypothetical protein
MLPPVIIVVRFTVQTSASFVMQSFLRVKRRLLANRPDQEPMDP